VRTSRIRNHIRLIVFAALLSTTASCAQTFDATTLGIDASMSTPVSAQVQGEEFKISKKAVYLLAGIVTASKPSLDNILASQVSGDARVANLSIEVRSKPSDVLITILTLGLVVPRTVTFEGVVIGR
jgi:hypothetical protein